MNIKLLTEHLLEFLSLKGGCTGSSESTFVKMPHCWKSHVAAHYYILWFAVTLVQTISPSTLNHQETSHRLNKYMQKCILQEP